MYLKSLSAAKSPAPTQISGMGGPAPSLGTSVKLSSFLKIEILSDRDHASVVQARENPHWTKGSVAKGAGPLGLDKSHKTSYMYVHLVNPLTGIGIPT